MLDRGEDIVLLDVRNPIDADKLWIDSKKRVHIDLDELGDRIAEIPKGKKLVVIDVNGKRSAIATSYLHGKGFQNLERVGGGMHVWVMDGQPTVIAR